MKQKKKTWLYVLAAIAFIVALVSIFGGDNEDSDTQTVSLTPTYEEGSTQALVQAYIADEINNEFSYCDITEISINDDSDSDGCYIALVRITWNQQNTGPTSKDVLEMYSNDLAAKLGQDQDKVSTVSIFWEIPYLNANAKWSYVRKDNALVLSDQMVSPSNAFD